MRKIIVHVGLPKTGTTTIQNALFSSREMLMERHLICYPGFAANHTDAMVTACMQEPSQHISNRLLGIPSGSAFEMQLANYDHMMPSLRKYCKSLIISAEGLSNLSVPELIRVREFLLTYGHDIEVLFWTRHPLRYATSITQEMLKGGMTLAEIGKDLPLPYFEGRLTNFFDAFGREKVRVEVFEEAAHAPGGIVAAFCRHVGIPEETSMEVAASATRTNVSLSALGAGVLDQLNLNRPRFVGGRPNPLRHANEADWLAWLGGPPFDLPLHWKYAIRNRSRPDVQWLNKATGRFLYLDVFEDGELDPPPELPAPDPLCSIGLLVSEMMGHMARVCADSESAQP